MDESHTEEDLQVRMITHVCSSTLEDMPWNIKFDIQTMSKIISLVWMSIIFLH
jgi:hypothetical protein